jgi:hypothetical protein
MANREGTGRAGVDRPRSGRAGVERGVTGAAPPWLGGAGRGSSGHCRGWAGPGRQCEEHLAVATVHVEAMREREAGERKGGAMYYTRLCSLG